eukprot:1248427-Prymnesium_polylepis.1
MSITSCHHAKTGGLGVGGTIGAGSSKSSSLKSSGTNYEVKRDAVRKQLSSDASWSITRTVSSSLEV